MIINKLILTNFRAYKQASFEFKQGMNLLVGTNGVGKTTVLDAIRVCLSIIYPHITQTKSKRENFSNSDIKIGTDFLQVSCDFTYLNIDYNLLIVKHREGFVANETNNIREQTIETRDQELFAPQMKIKTKKVSELMQDPVGVVFSTKRSLTTNEAPNKIAAIGGQAAAQAEALSVNRVFNLKLFADWLKVQEVLAEEQSHVIQYISALHAAVELFLPEFSNLHVVEIDGTNLFFIDKNGLPLSVQQLSDGERGVLSMVLEIAKRLTQANPVLANPLLEGKGIILIDELDLHLHPKWQRLVVPNLIRTFPNCQFIATTHSPQIIPSLDPERIQLINNDKVITPDRTLGMDSNWILKHLMDAEERPENALEIIAKVENLIDEIEFEKARNLIKEYKKVGFDLPEWSTFEARMAKLEILGGDETNN